ncbi:MAG: UDP-N-acetylmuramate--L-alanine ligase, partial [Vicinamibacteria bacterium]
MIGTLAPGARVHLLGVSGTAMASLAGLLKERGFRVTGSDKDCYPPMSLLLDELGIEVRSPYAPENLPDGVDLVVIGNALSRGNSELEAVLERRLRYASMPEVLKDLFLRDRTPVVVAGTHGKTTTSSLAAWILECAGRDPGFLIGGVPPNFRRSFRIGTGEAFVVEGDEYDTAYFDKGPKFLHYLPRVAVIGNVEFDHADIYRDAEEVERAFRLFANLVPRNGLLIVGIESERAARVAESAPSPVETFAVEGEADWTAEIQETGARGTRFRIRGRGAEVATVEAQLWGRASLRNVLAATAAVSYLGCSQSDIAKGISTFTGVKRRLEVRGVASGVTVVDDFAHHPTAIRETIAAARDRFPG